MAIGRENIPRTKRTVMSNGQAEDRDSLPADEDERRAVELAHRILNTPPVKRDTKKPPPANTFRRDTT